MAGRLALYELARLAKTACKVCALVSRPWRSSSDIAGSKTWRDAAATDDARQGEGHPKLRLQAADGDHGVLIVEHHFGNARRYNADAVLARIMAFDNCDVGVAHVLLYLLAEGSVFTINGKTNSQQNNDGLFALVAASETGVLPEIPATVQSTVWVAKLVIAMTAFVHAWSMHPMEVTNLGSVTSAQMTASATTCLRVGCKQTAG